MFDTEIRTVRVSRVVAACQDGGRAWGVISGHESMCSTLGLFLTERYANRFSDLVSRARTKPTRVVRMQYNATSAAWEEMEKED